MKLREAANKVADRTKKSAANAGRAAYEAYKNFDRAISPGTHLARYYTPEKRVGRTLRSYLFATVALSCAGVIGAAILGPLLGTFLVSDFLFYPAAFVQYVLFGDSHFENIRSEMPILLGLCSWLPYVGLLGLSGYGLVKHGPTLFRSIVGGLKTLDQIAALKVGFHSISSLLKFKTGWHNLVAFLRDARKAPDDPQDFEEVQTPSGTASA